jgi:dienelactone hydrolase
MARTKFETSIRRTARIARGLDRTLDLTHGDEIVPANWLTPAAEEPVPAVLLLHGFSSSRGRMSQAVGRPLLASGVASLALDLPYHGERSTASGAMPKNPLALVGAWRTAVAEARAAVDWLTAQPEVDAARIGVIGYSLGGFLALMTAADEPRLHVVALAAAGDLPDQTPYAAMVRSVVDPQRAARKLAGRPLLLLNGRRDTTTRPAQAERLFAAAEEPKSLLWYDGGHWPPPAAIDQVVQWMAAELTALARTARTTGRASVPRVRRERPA